MVIVKNKFTFVHIRKTAGTSIRAWIQNNFVCDWCDAWHVTLPEAKTMGYNNFGWKFCVTRNTFDRLVSHYKFQKDRHYYKLKELSYKDKWKKLKTKTEIYERDFEYWYDRQIDEGHYFTQIQYTRDCDYMIKFEKLNSNFRYIQFLTGCNEPLPYLNGTPGTSYKELYTPSLIKKVKKDYEEELETFKYTI
jgi:hypothetical protein